MDSSTLSNQETGDINRLLQLGIQAAKAGRREQARELLLQVVEQDQESIRGWLWLSGVLEDLEERRICLENVLIIDPAIITGPELLSRGGHYSQKKMWALAAIYFHQVSIKMPGNIKAHLALAFAYFNLKKFDLAEAALAEARRIDPASPLVKELEADLQERQPS
jgi:tetratricopeptide (TPR) repeat protein